MAKPSAEDRLAAERLIAEVAGRCVTCVALEHLMRNQVRYTARLETAIGCSVFAWVAVVLWIMVR